MNKILFRHRFKIISVIIFIILMGMFLPAIRMDRSGSHHYNKNRALKQVYFSILLYEEKYDIRPDSLTDLNEFPNGYDGILFWIKNGTIKSINDIKYNKMAKGGEWMLSVEKNETKQFWILYCDPSGRDWYEIKTAQQGDAPEPAAPAR